MRQSHTILCWPSHFAAILSGDKTFEVRLNDRDFAVGQVLLLREWDPEPLYGDPQSGPTGYSGGEVRVVIRHVLHGGQFGIERNWVVMAIKKIEEPTVVTP